VNENLPKASNYVGKNSGLKRTLKITLFRMWAAGAVCFFAAWGRAGAEEVGEAFSLNLIISLIFIMIICDLIIVNPVIRLASGQRVLGTDKQGWRVIIGRPLHIGRVVLLILLIVQTYYFLNVFFIRRLGLDENAVPVPLEPILFGILYGLYFLLSEIIVKSVVGRLFPALLAKENT